MSKFQLLPFSWFKGLKFELELSTDYAVEVQDIVHTAVGKWNKIHTVDINNTVDFVGNIQKIGDSKYEIFMDLGTADRTFIGMMLYELNISPIAASNDKIILM